MRRETKPTRMTRSLIARESTITFEARSRRVWVRAALGVAALVAVASLTFAASAAFADETEPDADWPQ